MPTYGISIKDSATPFVSSVMADINRGRPAKAMGQAASTMLMTHFANENNSNAARHKTATHLGAMPTQLFAKFARATHWDVSGNQIIISVSHPAAGQRYRGGRIKPSKNGGFLAIPINAASYGKMAREFGRVFAIERLEEDVAPDGRAGRYLVLKTDITKPVGRARKDGTRRLKTINPSGVYYRLIRFARQDPDPSVLPTDEQFFAALSAGFREWMQAQLDKRLNEGIPNG